MPTFDCLTVVFPMFNEELHIVQVVSWAEEVCEELVARGEVADYEILIVNDASSDRTALLAEQLARRNVKVRAIHRSINGKLGRTLRTGFAKARGDVVLYTDADLPVDLHETIRALRILRNRHADVVSAYRDSRAGEGVRRTIYSAIYNRLIRGAFGLDVRDVNFAFKLVRREVLEAVCLRSNGSFIAAELLVSAQRLGYRIVQFKVEYFPRTRGTSTLASPQVIATMLKECATLRPGLLRLGVGRSRDDGRRTRELSELHVQ